MVARTVTVGRHQERDKPAGEQQISNWIAGNEEVTSGGGFEKRSPHDSRLLSFCARSGPEEVARAVAAARDAQPAWAATPPVQRGQILHQFCNALERQQRDIAAIVAAETGKTPSEAFGEVGAAIACGRFFAGEGQRLYGRTTTSGTPNKYAMTVRQPCGVAALIIAANTPAANTAWKIFPAMICGNAVVLKAAEDTPATSWIFGKVAQESGIPPGVLNIVQGFGQECGAPLVEHPDVDVVSFTGSTAVGRWIAERCGRTLKKVSLELGGKNPFIVCDDADLDAAVSWLCLSAFSNAGQRCAAGSRAIIFDAVYDRFTKKLVEAAQRLKVGPDDGDDFGPVINERQLTGILAALERGSQNGASILTGGERLSGSRYDKGWYLAPTIIEEGDPQSETSRTELFGPVVSLYRAHDFADALRMANSSRYGLTACIHTRSIDRATHFAQSVRAGVAVVNAGTYGSEPHMPFGGVGQSGNGSREPGTEALDVYSELKDIYVTVEPSRL